MPYFENILNVLAIHKDRKINTQMLLRFYTFIGSLFKKKKKCWIVNSIYFM